MQTMRGFFVAAARIFSSLPGSRRGEKIQAGIQFTAFNRLYNMKILPDALSRLRRFKWRGDVQRGDLFLRRSRRVAIGLAGVVGVAVAGAVGAEAAEDGKGFYLLGSNASMAGAMPPPGTTFVSYDYYYRGDASGRAATGILLDQTGARLDLEANVEVDAAVYIKMPAALWVAPRKVLGGGFGVGMLMPIGWQDISADVDVLATLTLPDGRTFSAGDRFSINDDTFTFGDPAFMAFLGWNSGPWHWKVTGLLNVPIGVYDADNLANIGFNRWAFDASAAVTWLDPAIGFEVSTVAGFTFNGENPDTDYKTGTEFHLEYALVKHFSPAFSAGLVGYHYQQITGDSGAGASLGAFKGRTTAIGPVINYNTTIFSMPLATSLRWYHELDVKNRLEGDAFLFQATMPLGVTGK